MTNDTLIDAAERCSSTMLACAVLTQQLKDGQAATPELIADALQMAQEGMKLVHSRAVIAQNAARRRDMSAQ